VAASQRSSFFFVGHLEPPELANFNVQNVFLRDRRGGVVEVFGHSIAVWWPSLKRAEFRERREDAEGWFTRIASAYYLESDVALQPRMLAWVEAVDVEAREAVIGVVDARFYKIPVVAADNPVNEPVRVAIDVARRLKGTGELERATSELLRAVNDPSPQAFLSAFRALECIRRIYEPDFRKRRQGWITMARDLGVKQTTLHDLLADAAEAIRHGDVPLGRRSRHPVNRARRKREELLTHVRDLVAAALERHAPP
jgi:hypothetical protein